MDNNVWRDALKLIIVCSLWYCSSASGNVIGKLVLNEFPFPMTVTMVQLLSAAVYLGPILKVMSIPSKSDVPRIYYMSVILPLAMGKFLASVFSHISLWKVSVSYAHTVKATLPLFTVLLSRILLGEKQTFPVYISLLPIIGGVIIATLTEISFDMLGLLSALTATLGFSLQTIFSKKCLKDTGLHHLQLLLMLSRLAAFSFLPVWLLFDLRKILSHNGGTYDSLVKPAILLFFDGVFSMLQNVLAFTVLAMVAPLSYAVANATKRIVIIGASLLLLRNPVTKMNLVGMSIAVLGVLVYNKAKYDQNQKLRREKVLPLVHSDSDLVSHEINKLAMTHSKSTSNFGRNGVNQHITNTVERHIQHNLLLQNNVPFENVTLIPVSRQQHPENIQPDRRKATSGVHSRAVFHV